MNLLLLEPGEPDAAGRVLLHDERARHLRSVLKVVPGQSIRVGIVDGPLGTGYVASASDDGVLLDCGHLRSIAARYTAPHTTSPAAPGDIHDVLEAAGGAHRPVPRDAPLPRSMP